MRMSLQFERKVLETNIHYQMEYVEKRRLMLFSQIPYDGKRLGIGEGSPKVFLRETIQNGEKCYSNIFQKMA